MLTQAERKLFKSLSLKKVREANGIFLVEGLRSVREAVGSDFVTDVLLHTRAFVEEIEGRELISGFRTNGVRVEAVTPTELSAIADTVHAQGVAAIVRMKRTDARALLDRSPRQAIFLALDAVSDPGNVGTIIRTADWFGVDGVLLGRGSVDVYNPKVVRSSMGSVFHIPFAEGGDLRETIGLARASGFRILATGTSGTTDVPAEAGRLIVLFGNEAHGVSPDVRSLVDGTIAIPRAGRAESLNVSVACGIILSEFHRKNQKRSG